MKPVRQLTYYTGTYNETDLWKCLCLRFCFARLLQERLNIPSDWCGISTVYKQKKVIRCSLHTILDIVNFLPEPIYTHLYETNANDDGITACGAMHAGELVNVYRCNENNNKTGL